MIIQVGSGKRGGKKGEWLVAKNVEFNIHSIGLYATQAEHEVVFLQFVCSLTLAMEEAQNRKGKFMYN